MDNNINYIDISEAEFKQALKDIKALAIPKYDVDHVALHMIVIWHDLFESIDRDSENIEEIEEIMQDANTWFTDTIHDSATWETEVGNILIDFLDCSDIWQRILDYSIILSNEFYQDKYPESKDYLGKIYNEVYNVIKYKVNELTKPEVIYYCECAIKRRKKVNTRP